MSEQSIEVVKRAYAAFAEGDVPAVLGVFADDIEWHEADGMSLAMPIFGGEPVELTGGEFRAYIHKGVPQDE